MSDRLTSSSAVIHADRVTGRVCELQNSHLLAGHVPEVVKLFLGEVEYSPNMALRYDENMTRR